MDRIVVILICFLIQAYLEADRAHTHLHMEGPDLVGCVAAPSRRDAVGTIRVAHQAAGVNIELGLCDVSTQGNHVPPLRTRPTTASAVKEIVLNISVPVDFGRLPDTVGAKDHVSAIHAVPEGSGRERVLA